MTGDEAGPQSAVAVVVVAAGSGARLGATAPKAFAALGAGTILERALEGVRRGLPAAQCVIVVPADRLGEAERIAARVYGDAAGSRAMAVVGGAERAESVALGLAAVEPSRDVVLVHDAARALAPAELFDRVARLVAAHGRGVVPVLPIVDTVKRVGPDGAVLETLDRNELALAQTPQGFLREALERAYLTAGVGGVGFTDDAALAAAAGLTVVTAPGDPLAFKITTPDDLRRAEAIVGGAVRDGAEEELRTGVGVDAHRFEAGIPLWLGGLEWAGAPAGLAGHSDGDVACHAIVDALLSAAGLGDIGAVFGVDDPARRGTAGATFIAETTALLAEAGWAIRSVAVEIVANAPKIGPRREELERRLSELVGAPVAVAGTTSDGLGLTGGGEGIAAVATALISRGPGPIRLTG